MIETFERSYAELYNTMRGQPNACVRSPPSRTFVRDIETQAGVQGAEPLQRLYDESLGLIQEMFCYRRASAWICEVGQGQTLALDRHGCGGGGRLG